MPSHSQIDSAAFSGDVLEFIRLLAMHKVRCLIVGGEAVIFHGYPRLTGDIDFFYEMSGENCQRLFRCLSEFWNGNIPGIESAEEFMEAGVIVQFGRPPNRIDLLNAIDGVDFPDAWEDRVEVEIAGAGVPVPTAYIGKASLLKNKESSGRPKDLDDVWNLSRA